MSELPKISKNENLYFKPVKPKLSDVELISLILLAEFKSIDSEKLFRIIFFYRRNKNENGRKIQRIRELFCVDSMPLEVCKIYIIIAISYTPFVPF